MYHNVIGRIHIHQIGMIHRYLWRNYMIRTRNVVKVHMELVIVIGWHIVIPNSQRWTLRLIHPRWVLLHSHRLCRLLPMRYVFFEMFVLKSVCVWFTIQLRFEYMSSLYCHRRVSYMHTVSFFYSPIIANSISSTPNTITLRVTNTYLLRTT